LFVKVIYKFEEEISKDFASVDDILVDYCSPVLVSSQGIKSNTTEDVVGNYKDENNCGEVDTTTSAMVIDLCDDL
jgi:hypothetical protein